MARKTILMLEQLIDALRDALPTVAHNRVETEHIIDSMIEYQNEYKTQTGEYYPKGQRGSESTSSEILR